MLKQFTIFPWVHAYAKISQRRRTQQPAGLYRSNIRIALAAILLLPLLSLIASGQSNTKPTDEQIKNRKQLDTLIDEATRLKNEIKFSISPKPFQEALKKGLQALKIAQDGKDTEYEAACLFLLGVIYHEQEDYEKALSYFEKTLLVISTAKPKSSSMRDGETLASKRMGDIYLERFMYEEALTKYSQALSLYQRPEDENIAEIWEKIGAARAGLGDFTEAEKAYTKARKIYQQRKLTYSEGIVLSRLGALSSQQENKAAQALNYFLDADRLLKDSPLGIGYQDRRIFNLFLIAEQYKKLKDRGNELDYLNRAENLLNNIQDPDVRLAYALSIGEKFQASGDLKRALEIYEKALVSLSTYKSRAGLYATVVLLKKIGFTYFKITSGNLEKSFEYFVKAHKLVENLKDKYLLATLLRDIAGLLFQNGIFAESSKYYMAAFRVSLSTDNYGFQAETANLLSMSLLEEKKPLEALKYSRMALWLSTTFGSEEEIAEILNELMISLTRLDKRRLAIFFGKQSVNLLQKTRTTLSPLKIETQKAFLKGNRRTYEQLAELLIQEGRLEEAQEVINHFQDQEFFDFSRKNVDDPKNLSLTQRETEALKQYDQLREKLRQYVPAIENRDLIIKSRPLTEQEQQNLEKLKNPFKETSLQIESTLKQIEDDFNQPLSAKDTTDSVKDVKKVKALLANAKSRIAVIYTLTAEDNFYILLTTPDGIKAFSHSIKADDLNTTIQDFLGVLRSPNSAPYNEGSKLYDTIFKSTSLGDKSTTLEIELEKYKPEILLWSLDGSLRYIPMVALYDVKRKQYLVEKYETAVFTRVRPEHFLREPKPWMEGLGLGISEQQLAEIFSGDMAVGKRGMIKMKMLIGLDFNRDNMIETMRAKRRPLVHISSHFLFRPGSTERSYLLLSNEEYFSLADMQKIPDLFAEVELLTLAACETAAQQPDSNGTEIDGFAELAQRLGANSVIATLWNVSAKETSKLMIEFYRLHQGNPDRSKAEILRQAQLNLLKGKVTDLKSPLAHPYYWAPFVLYGSFR